MLKPLLRLKTLLLVGILVPSALAFHSMLGKECEKNEDCLAGGFETCVSGSCQHKSLWPMLQSEYWGMIAVFAALWFANMGGISGGGIVVPIAIGFFKFDPKNAIALSNFSICIGSILRFLLNAKKSHPLKNGKGLN